MYAASVYAVAAGDLPFLRRTTVRYDQGAFHVEGFAAGDGFRRCTVSVYRVSVQIQGNRLSFRNLKRSIFRGCLPVLVKRYGAAIFRRIDFTLEARPLGYAYYGLAVLLLHGISAVSREVKGRVLARMILAEIRRDRLAEILDFLFHR